MNKRQGVLEYLDLRRERKAALTLVRSLILASSLCEEDEGNGERICLHHGNRWEYGEPVCNGVLNAIDELEGH